MKLTSAQWQVLFPCPHVTVPDGWDHENFEESWWEEEIDFQEYERRLIASTCVFTPRPSKLNDRIAKQVNELVGLASMAWEPLPDGVFDPSLAIKISDRIMQMVELAEHFREEYVYGPRAAEDGEAEPAGSPVAGE